MRSRKDDTGVLAEWVRPIGLGTLIGAVGCLLALLGMAALLLTRDFPLAGVTPMASVVAVCGAFVGGFAAGRFAGKNGWLVGLATGIILFVVLLLAGGFAMLQAGKAGGSLTRLAMMAAAAAVGGIVSVNTRKRR